MIPEKTNELILDKLSEIERTYNVSVLFAVESGSRAWGFPSPDSDYDVRFVYVRTLEDYLKLEKVRDTIEFQEDEVYDINGWDLKKALQLMYDSNPSIFEWCASPIVYKTSDAFNKLKAISKSYYSPKKNLYHYWHMANSNFQKYLQTESVRIKKYFYVIRPLLAAKWVVEKGAQPPMLFSELIKEELPPELYGIIQRLLEMKQNISEMGLSSKISELDEFIDEELIVIKKAADDATSISCNWDLLDQFFYNQVMKP